MNMYNRVETKYEKGYSYYNAYSQYWSCSKEADMPLYVMASMFSTIIDCNYFARVL